MARESRGEAFYAVVNPIAGGGRSAERAHASLDRLREGGLTVIAETTSAPRHAIDLVRQAWKRGFRRFLAVGGDGTSWEVLNGMMPMNLEETGEASLGFLPLGTGNSFLREFSEDPAEHAMRSLLEGRRSHCDVLCLRHRTGRTFFINLLGWGFATEVAERAVRHKRWGALGYVMAVLQCLLRHRPPTVIYQSDDREAQRGPSTLVCICNSRFTAGAMMMAPDAQIDDGMADVIRVEPMGRLAMLRTFPRIFTGSHLGHPAVSSRTARRIELRVEHEIALMIDGEILNLVPEAIEVLPGALEIWC